jgi:Zn2+/Cd2+-exporting ATPase
MAAVEQPSEHPLGAAIVRAARERNLAIPPIGEFEALPGRGAQARLEGRTLWAGGPRLARERAGDLPDAVEELHAAGQTALVLGEDDRPLATFGVADGIRPEAADVVASLARVGVARTVMLTGDSEPVARAIAGQTGIGQWRAGLLPEDKLAAISALEADGGGVAMVGDGINDAPALAAARVGVAMGAAGSDVALQAADVALMSDRLDRLPFALDLARRARGVMVANVVASLAVKGLFVLLAPLGLVTLVLAVAADMGLSLLVTLNALRLLGRAPGVRPATGR